MSLFLYEAIRTDGGRVNGEIDAKSRAEAHLLLERKKLQPVSLKIAADVSADAQKHAAKKAAPTVTGPVRLSQAQIIFFTEELSDLLDAGLQLESALKVIEDRQAAPALKQAAARMRQLVRDGMNFSDALRSVSPSFGELYCSLVSAGELSGALPKILKRQVKYLNTMQDLRSQIVQALIYPSFIVGAGILMMFLFMIVLVPQLMDLFDKSDRELPLVTKILIGTSTFLQAYWWLIIAAVFGLVMGFLAIIRQPAGREWWDRVKLDLPLFGQVLRSGFLAQFSQTLSNLVGNGLPLLTGMRLMERATTNTYLKKRITRISEIVAEGGSLSRSMKRVGGFPDVFVDLVGVGEQTGEIGNSLEKAAIRYEKDMNRRITRITALIQPVIICVIAVIVGVVIYSIITSIFEAISGMRPER